MTDAEILEKVRVRFKDYIDHFEHPILDIESDFIEDTKNDLIIAKDTLDWLYPENKDQSQELYEIFLFFYYPSKDLFTLIQEEIALSKIDQIT